jgi:DNA polymerase V
MKPRPLSQLARHAPDSQLTQVPTGFPSPADDYLEASLNLHDYMVQHPAATFFRRMIGHAMAPAIDKGDLLIIDRSLTPTEGTVILAVVDGEFFVRRLARENRRIILRPDNRRYGPIVITEPDRFACWGVVTYVVHQPNR